MAKSFNEKLLDEFIKKGLQYTRVEAHVANETMGLMRNLAEELTKTITKLEGGTSPARLARLETLQTKIIEAIATHYDELDARTIENGTAITKSELQWLGDTFNGGIGVDLLNVNLTKEALKSLRGQLMIEGAASSDWWSKQSDDLRFNFTKQMRQGIAQGEALNDLIRRIRGTRESGYRLAPDGSPAIMPAASRNAETLARTAVATAANDARAAVYAANADLIKGLQWHATLDPRTCKSCAPRDGQVWDYPDHKPKGDAPAFASTPLHFRCRCLLVPVTYSWEELSKMHGGNTEFAKKLDQMPKGTRASMNGQVPSSMTFNDWLKGQQPEVAEQVLGKERAALFTSGKIKASDLIDDNGRPLALAKLPPRTPTAYVQPRPTPEPRVAPVISTAPERLSTYFSTPTPIVSAPIAAKVPPAVETTPKPAKVAKPVDWQYVPDSQKGSNYGGMYDAGKKQYYVKFYKDMTQAETEIIAQKVNAAMGLNAPKLKIVEVIAPDGTLRRGLASEWIDGLKPLTREQMIAHKDIAKAYQAAVLTKNWDIVGTGFDNLMVTKNGKLVCIDAGGAFNFRARGELKEFGIDLSELASLRNPSLDSGKVFNTVFNNNVFAEKAAFKGVDIGDLTKIFKGNNLPPELARELKASFMGRLEGLIDRYNLDGTYTYEGFGTHLDAFKKWGGGAALDRTRTGTGAWTSYNLKQEMDSLVRKFENYVDKTILKDGARKQLKVMLLRDYGWSGNSSNAGGAVMKQWAMDFFGGTDKNLYQSGVDNAADRVRKTAERFREHQGVTREVMNELLKAEYEFQQYYLTRLNGYDTFQIERGMRQAEYNSNFKLSSNLKATYQNGGMYSATNDRCWESTEKRISLLVRNEDIFKTWYQGSKYMYYGSGESEFVTIGRPLRATELQKVRGSWESWESIK